MCHAYEKNLSFWAFLDLIKGSTTLFRCPGCAGGALDLPNAGYVSTECPLVFCTYGSQAPYCGLASIMAFLTSGRSSFHCNQLPIPTKRKGSPFFMWSKVLLKEWWANCTWQGAGFQKMLKKKSYKSEEKRSDHFPVPHLINICIKEWDGYYAHESELSISIYCQRVREIHSRIAYVSSSCIKNWGNHR